MEVIEQQVQRRGLSDGGIAATAIAFGTGLGATAALLALDDTGLVRNLAIAASVLLVLGVTLRISSRTRLTVRVKDGRPLLWVGRIHEKGPFVLQAGRRAGGRDEGPHALFLVVQKAGRDVCQFAELAEGTAPEDFPPRAMPPRVPAFYVRPKDGTSGLRQLRKALELTSD